jgi:hypothetical protein
VHVVPQEVQAAPGPQVAQEAQALQAAETARGLPKDAFGTQRSTQATLTDFIKIRRETRR